MPTALASTPALAEVCDKMRPDWSAGSGPVSMIGEVSVVLLSPIGGVLIVLCLLSWRSRSKIAATLTCGATGLLFWIVQVDRMTDIWKSARAEGCAGDPVMVHVALGLLACIAIMGAIRPTSAATRS